MGKGQGCVATGVRRQGIGHGENGAGAGGDGQVAQVIEEHLIAGQTRIARVIGAAGAGKTGGATGDLHTSDGQAQAGGIGEAHLTRGHGIAVVQRNGKAATGTGGCGDRIQRQGIAGGLGG